MTYQFASTADSGFQKANFFSFFTIQSNLLGGRCALPRSSSCVAPSGQPLFDGVRSGVVLYMAITGIVFALLLSGLAGGAPDDDPVGRLRRPQADARRSRRGLAARSSEAPAPALGRRCLARLSVQLVSVHACQGRVGRLVPVSVRRRRQSSATAACSGAPRCSWSGSRWLHSRCSRSATVSARRARSRADRRLNPRR